MPIPKATNVASASHGSTRSVSATNRDGLARSIRRMVVCLEPISKSPEEDNEASELYEAEEVPGVVFPTDEDAALPLNPSKEALHEPASHIAAQPSSCVGGLLLLLRCGAIISMPSLRNSSSSGSLS